MKKPLIAAIIFIFSAIFALAAETSKVLNSYAPPQGAKLAAFYLVYIGNESGAPELYVPIADKFLRVHFAPKQSLGQKYEIPYTKKLKFFSRSIKDGKEVFEEQEAVELPSDSAVVGMDKAGGKTRIYAADISFEKIPAGASAIINLAPYKIGFSHKNRLYALDTFGAWQTVFPRRGEFNMGQVSFFDIRAKPRLMLQRMHGNAENEHAILFIFGTEIPATEAIPLDTNQILPFVETEK